MDSTIYTLDRARAFSARAHVQGGGKAAFHLSSPIGWINDPNGFSVYQGKIHLFFQHHPYSGQWGPIHWGHVVTEDFVSWTLLPEAMAPDQAYESGCFSGSAMQVGEKHVLFYTSHLDAQQMNGHHSVLQTQSMAVGDGIDYVKHPENPLIDASLLPVGASSKDFRDPKVWQENDGIFKMVVASRAADHSGQILLFEANEMTRWRYSGTVEQSKNQFGKMWECPDFFLLEGQQILLFSVQEMKPDPTGEFHGHNGTACIIGIWDEKNHSFIRQSVSTIDYGWDFYAPQTCLLPDGRRMMVAWMQTWDNNITPPEQIWTGMMTFPRELRLVNNRLHQLPAREIERYYVNRRVAKGIIKQTSQQLAFGRKLDFTLTIKEATQAVFSLDVAANNKYQTRITYNAPAGKLVLDRSQAGMNGDRFPLTTMPLHHPQDTVKLRVLLDCYSLELFINDGEQTLTSLLYTPQEAQDVRLYTSQTLEYLFESWEIDITKD